ncbi:cysteine N-palmitoyltransferase HHAT-like [Homarus americanus]|uniref:Cysteine N-palmitoyltransferase HHAT-like n=1 Tax=Homarus americanus TaxID=6706 RepID=A0A8J5N308_HOMAM|nr:cysteine N-palmitoyltransferase HHAT-like [Homarus americanus]
MGQGSPGWDRSDVSETTTKAVICRYGSLGSLFINEKISWGPYLPVTLVQDSWFGVRQDQTDLEWFVWIPIILSYAPWGLVHVVLAQLIRKWCPEHLCSFYVVFSVCITVQLIGGVGTALCFIVPSIMFVVLLTRLKLIIWLTWCCLLILFNTQFFINLEICDTDPEGQLRPLPLLTTLLGYCLYLPFLCTGPYMPFTDFQTGLAEPYRTWTLKRVAGVGLQVIRFLWWMGFTQFLLYQFYAPSLHFMPQLMKKMSSWSMAGFVYFLTAFLQLKYVVLYGLPSVLARVEGYDPPRHPRCTLMTYRFSDVWRYFDHGLYRFMLKHIYIPWVGSEPSMVRQLQGTALVFTFVYVWHGVTTQIFWWATINFFGVVAEKIGDHISRMSAYEALESRWLPGAWQRRFHGLLAVFLYVPSLTALVIFISNLDNAKAIGHRIFISGFPQCTLSIFFFMFCLGQCSMELQNWKIRQKIKAKQS